MPLKPLRVATNGKCSDPLNVNFGLWIVPHATTGLTGAPIDTYGVSGRYFLHRKKQMVKIHIVIDMPEIVDRDSAYDVGIVEKVISEMESIKDNKHNWWIEIESDEKKNRIWTNT